MFTAEQIHEKLSQVRTGADFPVLAMSLKNLGVTYYETRMEDGRSIFHEKDGYEVLSGPSYEPITVADEVNPEQLKTDIVNHQQGKSGYLEISRKSASNGIEKWAVCLITMTCSYIDKAGNKVWTEHIPDVFDRNPPFTVAQIHEAHSKVKSGADFPAYIREIRQLGVTRYVTYVSDGHTDFTGSLGYQIASPAKYAAQTITGESDPGQFKTDLKAHQQGATDYLTFIGISARLGIEKWIVDLEKMTCTYYDKSGNEILVEHIPE